MTLHSCTEFKYLTTPLFCKHALRSSLECEIGTAVEPFRAKNNNVKLACYKIYQGMYYLLIFFFCYIIPQHQKTSYNLGNQESVMCVYSLVFNCRKLFKAANVIKL